MSTRQEMFDKMLAGLRKQGKPSLETETSELPLCAYRGLNDCKCAIGFLIPDDRYDPQMDAGPWDVGMILRADAIPGATSDDLTFLRRAQERLHDNAECITRQSGKPFMDIVEEGARSFADLYDLRYEAPETV